MERLESMKADIDKIICCHGETILNLTIVPRFKNAMKAFAEGTLPYTLETRIGRGVKREERLYKTEDGLGFIYPLD